MDKYIFLDIDGVIAIPDLEYDEWKLNDSCQDNLEYILKHTGAKLVISSSWRYATVEQTKQKFIEHGFRFVDSIVGVTIRGYHHIEKGFPMSIERGVEIKHWIDNYIHRENHQGPYIKLELGKDYVYVIIDDDNDMLLRQAKYFVQTNSNEGLTVERADRVVEILNQEC